MSYRTEYLATLKAAIALKHQCQSFHRERVFVQTPVNGGVEPWQGDVEVFDLMGHPKAEMCYAWTIPEPAGIKILTVLESAVVDSPGKAVQAAHFAADESIKPSRRWALRADAA